MKSYINIFPAIVLLWYILCCIDGRISEANSELDSEANRQDASVEPGLLVYWGGVCTLTRRLRQCSMSWAVCQ